VLCACYDLTTLLASLRLNARPPPAFPIASALFIAALSTNHHTHTVAHASQITNATRRMTLGMRIDAALASIDSLSSTTLYALVVGATIVIALGLLGSAKEGEMNVPPTRGGSSSSSSSSSSNAANSITTNEPKWHIFRYMNMVILVLFLASIVEFYWNDSLYVFLLGWSVFLCYFFGFFGVTFVHDMYVASYECWLCASLLRIGMPSLT
jgi:hypothetical protein